MFSAASVPPSQETSLDIHSHERRGFAMAIWGTHVMIGPIMGPMLGGYLTEHYDLRLVFYIKLPLGLLAAAGDRCRGFPRRPRHLPLCYSYGAGTPAAVPPRSVPGCQFLIRSGSDVSGRNVAGIQPGANDAMASGSWRLSGGNRRPDDGAARARQFHHHHDWRAFRDPSGPALFGWGGLILICSSLPEHFQAHCAARNCSNSLFRPLSRRPEHMPASHRHGRARFQSA
jgi:MFS family permease